MRRTCTKLTVSGTDGTGRLVELRIANNAPGLHQAIAIARSRGLAGVLSITYQREGREFGRPSPPRVWRVDATDKAVTTTVERNFTFDPRKHTGKG